MPRRNDCSPVLQNSLVVSPGYPFPIMWIIVDCDLTIDDHASRSVPGEASIQQGQETQ